MASVCVAHLEFVRDVHAGVVKNYRTLRQCYLADLVFLPVHERKSHAKS